MLSHFSRLLLDIGLCLLTPLGMGLVLWKWGGGEPDNAISHESGDDEERDPGDLLIAA